MSTIEITLDNHDSIVAKGIVAIDFYASWCGPCKAFAPIFEASSEANTDISYGTINTDEQQELAAQYNVRSIPTLVIYKDGKPVFSQPGAQSAPSLESLLTQVKELNGANS